MRVPLSWLKEWVDVPWEVGELADRLTAVGIEVDTIEYPGSDITGVVLARIVDVTRHPQADRLWVCKLDIGRDVVTVVTGAPNVTDGKNAWVIYAPPGAQLQGGVQIGTREVRGVESQGMLCSTWELGLPSDAKTDEERLAEGVLLLPADQSFKPGDDARPVLQLGEPVLVLELTPNLAAHCQSILGVAREIAAITAQPLRVPPLPEVEEIEEDVSRLTRVNIDAPDGCTCYIARIIDGVEIGPSPLWLRRRLQLAGMRPINNVVDVTNYVMLEMGQPLHGFDHDRLAEGRIVVRRAHAGERIITLDGNERELSASDLVIADAHEPVALAGIMGGANSEVTPSTRRVLLESAHFTPQGILRTSRRTGLRTEASVRFEKGLDPTGPEPASRRAAVLIAALARGRLIKGRVAAQASPVTRKLIPLRPDYINGLLGTNLPADVIKDHLQRYGFVIRGEQVEVPDHRTDVHGEADLAEEVARLYGYDRIPAVPPPGTAVGSGRSDTDRVFLNLKRKIVSCGFTEITTFSFAAASLPDQLRLPQDHPQRRAIKIANPMSEDQAALRTTLLGGALTVIRNNARHRLDNLALFELGTVYLPDPESDTLVTEDRHLLLAACGDLRPRHWQSKPETADVYFLKGVLERLAHYLRRDLTIAGAQLPFLHPGRSATLRCNDVDLGYLGELHPDLCEEWELPPRVVVAEVNLSRWMAQPALAWELRPIPRFPAIERDVAFELPDTIPAIEAEQLIRREGGQWLESVTLFDVYRGKQVAEGNRSLAYTLRYRAPDRTLTDEAVDAVHNRVRQALVEELGATLR